MEQIKRFISIQDYFSFSLYNSFTLEEDF